MDKSLKKQELAVISGKYQKYFSCYLLSTKKFVFALAYQNIFFKKQNYQIVPGSYVYLCKDRDTYYIVKSMEPKNLWPRPLIGNVHGIIYLLDSTKIAKTQTNFLQIYLLSHHLNINFTLIITKTDLATSKQILFLEKLINSLNIKKTIFWNKFLQWSTFTKKFILLFHNKSKFSNFCICGYSGSGKSTFINFLLKENKQTVGAKSGTHTTTTTTLFPINLQSMELKLFDTPGFSQYNFKEYNFTKIELAREFHAILLLNRCFFNDCLHINEKECKITKWAKLSVINSKIYNTYLTVIKDL